MEQVTFKKLEPELSIDLIDVSEENVRKTQREAGIEELKGSIERIGLVHPIIVLEKGDRFGLIVGQRRLLAYKELGRKTIPALVIAPLDEVSATVVSFGENIHRRKLPYGDTIKVCNKLFKEYAGTATEKISQIAKALGLSHSTVINYLTYQLIPKKVQDMVEEGRIPAQKAKDITAAFWPNEKRILAIAEQVESLTGAELDRAIDIGRQKPKEEIENIVEEAKKPPPVVIFTVTMPVKMARQLEQEAKRRNTTIHDLILASVENFLSEGA